MAVQDPIETLMSLQEAAEVLGISPDTLYNYVKSERIEHIRVGRLIKFKREHLERFMDRNYHGTHP